MKKILLCILMLFSILSSCGEAPHREAETQIESIAEIIGEPEKNGKSEPSPGNITIAAFRQERLLAEKYELDTGAAIRWVALGETAEDDQAMWDAFFGKYPNGDYPEEEADKVEAALDALWGERLHAALDGFRTGEVDMLYLDDSILATLLAAEGSAAPLDVLIGDLLTDEYFSGVIDAGRIGGTLYSITPFFTMKGIALPAGAVGELPQTPMELKVVLETLEEEYLFDDEGILFSVLADMQKEELARALDAENGIFTLDEERLNAVNEICTLLEKAAAVHDEEEVGHKGTFEPVRAFHLNALLEELTAIVSEARLPHDYVPVSRFEMERMKLPYSDGDKGFGIAGGTYLVSAKTKNREACAAYLRWLLSPSVQSDVAVTDDFSGYAKDCGVPLYRPAMEKAVCRWCVIEHPFREASLLATGKSIPTENEVVEYNLELCERADHYTFGDSESFFHNWLVTAGKDQKALQEGFLAALRECGFAVTER